MPKRILVVNNENVSRLSLCERLNQEGYACVCAENGAQAMQQLKEQPPDLAILDLQFPDIDGLELLEWLRAASPDLPAIMITACSSVDTAVRAMKLGAYDYIAKPFDMSQLVNSVNNILRSEGASTSARETHKFGLQNLIGNSPIMREIRLVARKLADTDATTILLLGETGTGKDMLALAIHYDSARVDKPFMNITCTALPDSLLDSELFGYEEGAFTGARKQKKGLFELADGGTVLLDEIGDMPAELQGKLLRVIEEKAFKRIGGTKDVSVNVRIVAATNRDLEKAIANRTFREDLYYRLSIIPLLLPPLRERREDIPALANHFLNMACEEHGRPLKTLTAQALERLTGLDWPGNIRQLRNVIERTALLCNEQEVDACDLQLGSHPGPERPERRRYAVQLPEEGCDIEDIEEQLLQQALERTRWNQTRAARLLHMSRDQIRYKMAKYRLKKPGLGRT
ncbi:MAG TPA: sigma-54 dependent transcriptional regulator [Candidatus Hydrogenedentes bacterium]|nr:sigma-54 dependent transcriptional regulator [Candidatus Hydrogenedentota bacterium]